MNYNFATFKEHLKKADDWLKRELSQIRTGRATPALLDSVQVEFYGAKVPVTQVGAITSEDPRTLRISPWDASQSKNIEKAITAANLGVSVAVDDKGLRVTFPTLTSETRTSLIKLAKSKSEEAKKTIRIERDKIWADIQAKEKQGGMSEDEKFRFKNEMQKLFDEEQKKLEDEVGRKEKEITS